MQQQAVARPTHRGALRGARSTGAEGPPPGPSLPPGPATGRKLTLLGPHQPGWGGKSRPVQAGGRTEGSLAWRGDRGNPGQLSRFSLSALTSADLNYSVLQSPLGKYSPCPGLYFCSEALSQPPRDRERLAGLPPTVRFGPRCTGDFTHGLLTQDARVPASGQSLAAPGAGVSVPSECTRVCACTPGGRVPLLESCLVSGGLVNSSRSGEVSLGHHAPGVNAAMDARSNKERSPYCVC